MKKTILIQLLFVCLFSHNIIAQTQVIAHRGYWQYPGASQNSITALYKASQLNIYGSEFDVYITSDGIPVLNHDNNIQGYIIEKTEYSKLRDLKLANGETLPTLEQFLIHGKVNKNIKLILEIKEHSTKEIEKEAVRIITNTVKSIGVEQQVEYISFSINVCKEIVKINPNTKIAYLKGDIPPNEIKELGLSGIDYHYSEIEKHPEWVNLCHQLGLTVNVWTINTTPIANKMLNLKVDFITTDKPEMELSSK